MSKLLERWLEKEKIFLEERGFSIKIKPHLSDECASVDLNIGFCIGSITAWDHINTAEIVFLSTNTDSNIIDERIVSDENEFADYFREFIAFHSI